MPQTATFYVKWSILPFEEDETHEFKGHRNISVEDVPKHVLVNGSSGEHSRKCISRNLNAFLNTGRGGTVFCGVSDAGRVLGLHMTRPQRDHVLLQVRNTLQRFRPAVPASRYRVRFVPVIDPPRRGQRPIPPPIFPVSPPQSENTQRQRCQPHLVASSQYCWCDADAKARSQNGLIPPEFIIELEILPWRPRASFEGHNSAHCRQTGQLCPFYLTENGKCFVRHQASVRPLSMSQCIELTRQQVAAVIGRRVQRVKIERVLTAAQQSHNSTRRPLSCVSVGDKSRGDCGEESRSKIGHFQPEILECAWEGDNRDAFGLGAALQKSCQPAGAEVVDDRLKENVFSRSYTKDVGRFVDDSGVCSSDCDEEPESTSSPRDSAKRSACRARISPNNYRCCHSTPGLKFCATQLEDSGVESEEPISSLSDECQAVKSKSSLHSHSVPPRDVIEEMSGVFGRSSVVSGDSAVACAPLDDVPATRSVRSARQLLLQKLRAHRESRLKSVHC